MRTIREGEKLDTLVKVGDIVRLEGFTDEPVIAVVTMGVGVGGCYGCAIDTDVSCTVATRDNKGAPQRISPCCIKPSWMSEPAPIFGVFKSLDKVLEDL